MPQAGELPERHDFDYPCSRRLPGIPCVVSFRPWWDNARLQNSHPQSSLRIATTLSGPHARQATVAWPRHHSAATTAARLASERCYSTTSCSCCLRSYTEVPCCCGFPLLPVQRAMVLQGAAAALLERLFSSLAGSSRGCIDAMGCRKGGSATPTTHKALPRAHSASASAPRCACASHVRRPCSCERAALGDVAALCVRDAQMSQSSPPRAPLRSALAAPALLHGGRRPSPIAAP